MRDLLLVASLLRLAAPAPNAPNGSRKAPAQPPRARLLLADTGSHLVQIMRVAVKIVDDERRAPLRCRHCPSTRTLVVASTLCT